MELFTFAVGFGGKIPNRDAIAYYFALTEKTSEICFGIVRIKSRGKDQEVVSLLTSMLCLRLWRGAFLYVSRGSNSEVCPSGKCIRMVSRHFHVLSFAIYLNELTYGCVFYLCFTIKL